MWMAILTESSDDDFTVSIVLFSDCDKAEAFVQQWQGSEVADFPAQWQAKNPRRVWELTPINLGQQRRVY